MNITKTDGGRFQTSGGPRSWKEAQDRMRGRGWFTTTTDSYWHSNDGYRAKVQHLGGGQYQIVMYEFDVTRDQSVAPYPWCKTPEQCGPIGYCPRDPNCGE